MSNRQDRMQLQAYNVKVVVQETGLKPETLRAWERRYGFPNPERSPGGHRLYSRQDIESVKWLMERQDQGLSISNAIDLWSTLIDQGQDPLHMSEFSPSLLTTIKTSETIEDLTYSWIKACKEFNERRAEQILTQAFTIYPIEMVCVDILAKGLARIGDGWYTGEISIQQEHFASELAMRRIENLIAGTPTASRNERILIAAPPEENHDFILLLLNLLLRRRSWEVIYLGANNPLEQLAEAIMNTKPNLVVSAAQQLHTAAQMLEMGAIVKKTGIPLAYGGRIFNTLPKLRNLIDGYFLGENIQLAPEIVEDIFNNKILQPTPLEISEDYKLAARQFQDRLPVLETNVWKTLSGRMPYKLLAMANAILARDIQAALTLGDMDFLGDEITWIKGLLVNYQIPSETLYLYLETYLRSARENLEPQAVAVIIWLEQLLDSSRNNGHRRL